MKRIIILILAIAMMGCATIADINNDGEIDQEEKIAVAIMIVHGIVCIGSATVAGYYELVILNPRKPPEH